MSCVAVWTVCSSVGLYMRITWLWLIKRVQWVQRRTTWLMQKLLSMYKLCSGKINVPVEWDNMHKSVFSWCTVTPHPLILSPLKPQAISKSQYYHWAYTSIQHEVHAVQSKGLLFAGSVKAGKGQESRLPLYELHGEL